MLMNDVDHYLALRRAAGFQLRVTEGLLRDFARTAAGVDPTHVRGTTAVTWAAKAPSLRQRDRRLKTVIQFARHLHAEDPRHEIPPGDVFAGPRRRRVPHIFTANQVAQILAEAGRLGPAESLRPHTYRTLFGLLAVCGLRISEALGLELGDVTQDGLLIRQTKFRKSRLVPMHPSAWMAVNDYLRQRRRIVGDSPHLFVSLRGRQLAYSTAVSTFLTILRSIGLRAEAGATGPRLHDLRHTFAVRALESCPLDHVASCMQAMSTYLGHAKLADTYWYLHATPQLMSGIADACRAQVEVTS